MKKIVVIGGGVAGLAAAHKLIEEKRSRSLDVEVVLLEKQNRLGGTILTEERGGFIIEGGPDCMLSEKPWALALAGRLGMSDKVTCTIDENKGTFVMWGSKLHSLPDGVMLMVPTRILPMLTSSLLSIPGKLRMGMDLLVPKRKDGKEETLAEFVTRRLGKEALDRIAEPLVAGVHAGHPESMSLSASFPRFKSLEDEYGSLILGMISRMRAAKKMPRIYTMFVTFENGLGSFIAKIAEAIGSENINTGVGVSSLGRAGEKWIVKTPAGDFIEADAVILATPSFTAAKILSKIAPGPAADLDAIPYVGTATVSMAYDAKDIENASQGFGFVVPRAENRKIMAATYTTRKFRNRAPAGKALIRCFIGGVHHPELVEAKADALAQAASEEIKDILKIKAEPNWAAVYSWPRSMPQTNVGHADRMTRVRNALESMPGVEIAGGAYDGLGIPDCVRVGESAAQKTLAKMFG